MSTKFFTNSGNNTLLNKFAGIFGHNPDIERFDALIGYLRSSGYFAIRPHLENVPQIRLLVGINVDEIMEQYHQKGRLFLADAGRAMREFREGLSSDIASARYSPEVEAGIRQFAEDVASKKIEIRAHPTKRLHAKIYLFIPKGFNEHKAGAVITGSSNLTGAGLGVEELGSNYEFNVLSHDFADVKFASEEFEKLWTEGVHVLPKVVADITQKSHLRDDLSPFDIYIKLLTEFFGPAIEYDPNSETDLPDGFMRLAYQMDAVKQGFLMLQKHHGFFLADVVGLGKTIIAVLIAKKFFYHNGFPAHLSRVLVVAPPALLDGWQRTLDKFDMQFVELHSSGSLHKIRQPDRFDLVIVDEAHKFRNDTADAYDELQRICKTPTRRRLKDNLLARKKVILVSATPLNNRPMDIRNLIGLFQDLKDSTLETSNLQHFFARRQKEYEQALRLPTPEAARVEVARIYEEIRTKVVTEITIRRTRTDLLEHELYAKDLEAQEIKFPKVLPPHKLLYVLSPSTDLLYDRTLDCLSRALSYNRYRAIGHLVPEKKLKYQNADRISAQLARIMKVLLLKRLDSSFHAFTQSLVRFKQATWAMVSMFQKGKIFIAPSLNVSEYIVEEREDELEAKILELQESDPTLEICTTEDFDPTFLPGLKKDLEILTELVASWQQVHEDPKLDEFLRQLKGDLLSPDINHAAKLKAGSPRLVVFSESKETTHYLKHQLTKRGFDSILTIDSASRKDRMPMVRANFDANVPPDEQADDYQIIISTEVLAEGVNLHRANVIVNYDTPWNSTRLMQRIGRVNRIGSTSDRVHIYNFFPTAQVDADIELKKKAIVKLQAFHSALGEDSQIYSTDEEVDNFGLFDAAEIQEERDESLAYLMELRAFKKNNPDRFREIRNLPLRARVGRKDRHREGATLTYIRNHRRDAFYYCPAEGELEELSFVEAARIFKAVSGEKAVPLHAQHHAHVNAGIAQFRETLHQEAAIGQVVDHQMGPNESKALRFLAVFINHPTLAAEEEKFIMRAAQTAIKRATFARLQRDLNALEKAHKKAPLQASVLLDKTLEILQRYPLQESADQKVEDARGGLSTAELAPAIILSESFAAH
ncbi:helicase-related protein [Prosthecobacter sp.]|uniref:helicase-related protein n=1 Tax=Prosthecobacter sp. TaxID=1965333 RepID=UPI0037840133